MVGKRIQFDDETWEALQAVARHLSAARRRGLCGASAEIWSAGRAKGGAQRERRSAGQEAALVSREGFGFSPILPALLMGGLESLH